MKPAPEPIVLRWARGEVSLGYLGRFRWRVVTPEGATEAGDAKAASAAAVERVFRGVRAGQEVAERAPLRLELPGGGGGTFEADPRMVNGWSYANARVRFDLGPHAGLSGYLAGVLDDAAEDAWARGVAPERAPRLGPEFSFEAFSQAPAERCRALASALTERIRRGTSQSRVVSSAVEELRALGHDLWNLDDGGLWGADHTRKLPGAGLQLSFFEEDDETGEPGVDVDFTPP